MEDREGIKEYFRRKIERLRVCVTTPFSFPPFPPFPNPPLAHLFLRLFSLSLSLSLFLFSFFSVSNAP